MTLEADSSHVAEPSNTSTMYPVPKEQEQHSEVFAHTCQYFSTPVHIGNKKLTSPVLDPIEDPLDYKSFFSVECDNIVHQLQTKEIHSWSKGKRKLEELDISTIEAEPAPFYCTPKSVLNDTTSSAKRRRIANLDHGDNLALSSHSSQINKSPVFRYFNLQCLGKSVEKMHQSWADVPVTLVQGEPNPLLTLTVPKRKLFQRPKRTQCSQLTIPVRTARGQYTQNDLCPQTPCNAMCVKKLTPAMEAGSSMLEEWKTVAHMPHQINNKNDTQVPGSTGPALEYRSFFAAECEKIYSQLKIHDIERMNVVDFSTIEAELPPFLSTMLHLENTRIIEKSALCVSQLDFDKMNINHSLPRSVTPSQSAPEDICSSNGIGQIEKATIANITQDIATIHGERSVDDAMQEAVTIHGEQSEAYTTRDIETLHDKRSVAGSMHDIVATCFEPKVELKDTTCSTQEIGAVCSDMSVADVTHDILLNMEPTTAVTEELPVSKNMHYMNNIANSTHYISIATDHSAIAQHSLQDKDTIFNAEKVLTPTCSEPVLSCNNLVSADTHLTDMTYMQERGNSKTYAQDVLSTPTRVAKAHTISKTFKHSDMRAPNIVQDTCLKSGKGTTTSTLCDVTTRCHDLPTTNMTRDEKNHTCESERRFRQMWPVADEDHASPIKGNMFNSGNSMCELDLTDFAYGESVICTHSLITSTPLPGTNNPQFIKKTTGHPVEQKPSSLIYKLNKPEQAGTVATQHKRNVPPLPFPVQSRGDIQIKKRISKGLKTPGSLPKSSGVSTLFQPVCGIPVPCSSQAFNSVFKTPLMAAASTKGPMGPGRTNIPTVAVNMSSRKKLDAQQWKSRTSSSSLQQQISDRFVSKKGPAMSKLPMVSSMQPSFELCTPYTGKSRQKVQNIAGAQSAVCNYRVSSLQSVPVTGFVASEVVRPEQTFICFNQPAGSEKVSSKTKSRLPGLPIRKPKGSLIKHSNREQNI